MKTLATSSRKESKRATKLSQNGNTELRTKAHAKKHKCCHTRPPKKKAAAALSENSNRFHALHRTQGGQKMTGPAARLRNLRPKNRGHVFFSIWHVLLVTHCQTRKRWTRATSPHKITIYIYLSVQRVRGAAGFKRYQAPILASTPWYPVPPF